MGNRVAKSGNLPVKVQRVDGSYTNNIVLRCTLTGFERNYHAGVCSNLITQKSAYNRPYHTTTKLYNSLGLVASHSAPKVNLNPWFVTGFTDAEGCFALAIRKKNGRFYCEPRFAISLHNRDLSLLKEIQDYFCGAGSIVKHGKDSSQYVITSVKQLSTTILTHFDSYPLITQKYADYCLFKMAVDLIKNKAHLTTEGLEKVVAIRKSLNLGLSSELEIAFPKLTVQIPRVSVIDQTIPDPY